MKKSKIMSCVAILLSLTTSISAKESYYYYNNNKIPLQLCDDSVNVYITPNECENRGAQPNDYSSMVISYKEINTNDKKNVTSVEYIIKGIEEGKTVKMSNRFYVQLFDSVADVAMLQNISNKTNTIIQRKVPHMPDWYEIVVHHSIINNTLEMSNYFYETGLFKSIDPGFIFNFSESCVTDSYFTSHQWGLPRINACEAWNITKGNSSVKIAILDGNIYTPHTEFSYTQFTDFYNTTNNSSIPDLTYSYHGTMLGGIIAADHNHAWIAGVVPNCKIMPISYAIINTDSVAQKLASGISWAVNHGAGVINCSWGDHNGAYQFIHSSLLESAIHNALFYGREGKGTLVVFASGNQGVNQVDYPAGIFPEILTVGAINSSNIRPYFSSFGLDLDVVAPGVSIYSTAQDDFYDTSDGTSYSAAFVSGIAGLVLSANPNLTRKEVVDIIESTTQKIDTYSYSTYSNRSNGTWNDSVGYGLVDAYAAVYKARYKYMLGPDYICMNDTVIFQLLDTPTNAISYSWTADPGFVFSGTLNIIEGQGTPTIRVWLREYNVGPGLPRDGGAPGVPAINPPYNHEAYVKVTVTLSDNTTYTIKKILHHPRGATPTIDVSSTATPWKSGTSRLFTITNNTSAPGEDLHWKITDVIFKPTGNDTTITYSTGNMLYYTPYLPPAHIGAVTVTATNTFEACEVQTDSITFGTYNPSLHAPQQVPCRVENHSYTLELWHSIYGLLRTQPAQSAEDQIDTSGLSQGLYIIILKENGQPIKQTKLLIP